jgi:DNA-3-methyladenine glycosylase I
MTESKNESKNETKNGLIVGFDHQQRCWWPGEDPAYLAYHDHEWGVPVDNDHLLFEKICLEGFQAGLSWLTILRKRENFRAGFDQFNFEKIARYDQAKVEQLLLDSGIVRHRGKIQSVINNAQRACDLLEFHDSLAAYLWRYEPAEADRPERCDYATLSQLAKTPASIALSKDLKKQGWSFVGPTTVYAFMQAVGMVNDHLEGCWCRAKIDELRAQFHSGQSL